MPVRSVHVPYLNKTFKLGRKPGVARAPRLRLANYLTRALPPPPLSCDYSPAAAPALAQVYKNDALGDCVIACMAHVVGLLTANAGSGQTIFTDQQVIDLYSAIGGYVPGDPSTDNGCNETDALNWWHQYGAPRGAHQIAGYLAVNTKDPGEYRTALWLFENLVYGIPLPDSWLKDPAPGFVWDADRPDQRNGHCVAGVGYSPAGVKVATWGFTGTITDAAHAADVDELYVIISRDALNKASQKAPNGFDWAQLVADFDALGGNVPAPSPVPPTPTPPTPTPPPVPVPPAPLPIGPTYAQIVACNRDVFSRLLATFAPVRGAANVLRAADTLLEHEHAALFQQ